ncbi:MAG: hypothetical protein JXR69_04240 [Candidatus Delongbacteria bacterium]|nr:hypothetical protein [Candidatus Delongbacteria bacterium]
MPITQTLISLIESPDYKLIFRYKTGESFFGPDTRDYNFELYRCIKDHSKLIFKEWEPLSNDNIEEDPEFKMGKVERYTPKIMELIKEFPPPEDLKKYDVCDGSMSELMIHVGKKKIKYDWMMLDESQERFEKRIRQIGYIAKNEYPMSNTECPMTKGKIKR